MRKSPLCIAIALLLFPTLFAQNKTAFLKENFDKIEVYIPMRDGVRLYTVIFQPKDSTTDYPFLMERTPYSAGPYGEGEFPYTVGPNVGLLEGKYIFVTQDVRGRYKSEGNFEEMTPNIENKTSAKQTDESSDTYDTIEWLLKNIKHHNGRVGIHGISYPGFYATASLPGAHPAIKAVSPQAPVTDEFIGDDVNHKGAFFLMDNFSFMNYFDKERKGPVESYGSQIFNADIKDAYDFYLRLGTVGNANGMDYFNNKAKIWNEITTHDTYDDYWKARNIRTSLKNIKPAVLVVGGWFDAEDLFGALETYRAIEKQNPGADNKLVMGPWTHGAWASPNWSRYAGINFDQNTSKFYQDSIETVFFNYHLKDVGSPLNFEAKIFETGSNTWKSYQQWPPENATPLNIYLHSGARLNTTVPSSKEGYTMYNSDPDRPVPYTAKKSGRRNNEYMAEDQTFASERKDVASFTGEVLENDLLISGPVKAELKVSTSGTDADFVVKIIDVEPSVDGKPEVQRLVRAEVIRGKFRNDFSKPVAFTPNKIESVNLDIPDIAHLFKKGHKLMIQIQSSWFPLVDRNPQKFMHIPSAKLTDFRNAQIRIYHQQDNPSRIIFPVIH
ncbi:CocE/NonD family hydrolase [Pollutibacter soli]|uniref:CocE/NonD family hydrolase n=1 Tax=Pollutibacter soli TaxID=3034157 RepID=UPI0030141745